MSSFLSVRRFLLAALLTLSARAVLLGQATQTLEWRGLKYEAAPLFTACSTDGKSISNSNSLRIYHGFGDPRIRIAGSVKTVARESR